MSRRVHLAPLAVTSDGEVLLNVAAIAPSADVEAVVRTAKAERSPIFIGVLLSRRESELVMARLDNAADETAARIVGRRRTRSRARNENGK